MAILSPFRADMTGFSSDSLDIMTLDDEMTDCRWIGNGVYSVWFEFDNGLFCGGIPMTVRLGLVIVRFAFSILGPLAALAFATKGAVTLHELLVLDFTPG